VALRLDPHSRQLLVRHGTALFLGVVVRRRDVFLFLAGREVDESRQTFPGHQALLDTGVVDAAGARGFSFQLRDGEVVRFYRNSILNRELASLCLPMRQVDMILEACGLNVAADFECYP
jgi:hypothetical protein